MAQVTDCTQTSSEIADPVGTNPIVVRRVLGKLRKAGLLAWVRGHSGGWRRARASYDITLADISLALEESPVAPRSEPEPHSCQIERYLEGRVIEMLNDIEATRIDRLSSMTIAEIGSDTPLKGHL